MIEERHIFPFPQMTVSSGAAWPVMRREIGGDAAC
jgi:hypothetical protein